MNVLVVGLCPYDQRLRGYKSHRAGLIDYDALQPYFRDGDWKLLRFYTDGREELYNLRTDIGETKNLLALRPKKASELRAQLDTILKAHNAIIPTKVPAKPKNRPVRKKRTPKKN